MLENFGGMLDFAAARAGEVAAEERFQHQHKGKALASGETLLDQVATDANRLLKLDCHSCSFFKYKCLICLV